MGWRIYCRDYEVSEDEESILVALEAAYGGEMNRLEEWKPAGWDIEDEPPEEVAA